MKPRTREPMTRAPWSRRDLDGDEMGGSTAVPETGHPAEPVIRLKPTQSCRSLNRQRRPAMPPNRASTTAQRSAKGGGGIGRSPTIDVQTDGNDKSPGRSRRGRACPCLGTPRIMMTSLRRPPRRRAASAGHVRACCPPVPRPLRTRRAPPRSGPACGVGRRERLVAGDSL